MTDNKMLLKEFSKIYASCNKAKQGAIVELAKIDEKYRKLAEKEKEELNELVKTLEEQMEMYGNYLGLNKTETVVEETEEAEPETETETVAEEPVIEDTIFPENNEEPKEEKKGMTMDDIVETVESAGIVNIDEVVKEEEKEEKKEAVVEDIPELNNVQWPDGDDVKLDANGWPEWPEA